MNKKSCWMGFSGLGKGINIKWCESKKLNHYINEYGNSVYCCDKHLPKSDKFKKV